MSEGKVGRHLLIVGCSLAAAALLGILAFCSILQPWLALVPGCLLAALYWISQKKLILVAAGCWLCYFPYEFGMKLRILCSGECNIRVDLLLVYPFLLLVSLIAFVVFLRSRFILSR